MVSCLALRLSLTFDVARCFGRFAGTRGPTSVSFAFFCRIRVTNSLSSSFFVFVNGSLFLVVIPLFLSSFTVSAYRSPFSCRVASHCFLVFRVVFVFRLSCSLCVSDFRRGASFVVRVFVFVFRLASCEVTFAGPLVDRRICSVLLFVRNTKPAKVDKVTPVASSSAGNDPSNVLPPVASVPSVPSSVPAPSSSVAGPSSTHVSTPTSTAADAMMTSLLDTVRSRAPVAPVPRIVPSTPSEYTRCTGTVIRNVNEVVGSETEELFSSPVLVMPRLDSRCLFRTDCSLRGRGSFDRDDILTSGRADVKLVRDLAHSVGTAGIKYTERYMDHVRGACQIPSALRYDHLFRVEASDAKYFKLVERYLFDPMRPYPGFGDRTLRDVLVRTEAIRR